MTVDVQLGRRVGPYRSCVEAGALAAYADFVGAPGHVPATTGTLAIWDAQNEAREALVTDRRPILSAVHGEHDLVVHRPIQAGEELHTWVDGHGCRPAGRNVALTLHYLTVDGRDRPVVEQWWTTIYPGASCRALGRPAPSLGPHTGGEPRPAGSRSVAVTADMAHRYAEISGDWSRHHFDAEAARAAGADQPFLHGLAAMAVATQVVVDLVAGGAPDRVRRVAVRFARPTPIGRPLDVECFEIGPTTYSFEGRVDGTTVLAKGRLELTSGPT